MSVTRAAILVLYHSIYDYFPRYSQSLIYFLTIHPRKYYRHIVPERFNMNFILYSFFILLFSPRKVTLQQIFNEMLKQLLIVFLDFFSLKSIHLDE